MTASTVSVQPVRRSRFGNEFAVVLLFERIDAVPRGVNGQTVYELLDRKVFDLFKEIGLALLKDGDESGIRRRIDLRNSIDASQIDVDLLRDEVVLWHSALTVEVQPGLSLAPAPHSPAARQDDVPSSCTPPLCCVRRFDDEIALTGTVIITRIGSDNSLERLTERGAGLVTDRSSHVCELLVALL
jgi:hypothetical protein